MRNFGQEFYLTKFYFDIIGGGGGGERRFLSGFSLQLILSWEQCHLPFKNLSAPAANPPPEILTYSEWQETHFSSNELPREMWSHPHGKEIKKSQSLFNLWFKYF